MSAPLGNDNASKKNRMFSDELRKMYVQKRRDILNACEALADKAESGDVTAIMNLPTGWKERFLLLSRGQDQTVKSS